MNAKDELNSGDDQEKGGKPIFHTSQTVIEVEKFQEDYMGGNMVTPSPPTSSFLVASPISATEEHPETYPPTVPPKSSKWGVVRKV